ncbi:hypothetical protein [Burkholderia oklahomensis]|nr:hypothetical protein [Burkholderia oklahomensis]AOI44446.1 ethanolamine ammonia-lyase [Burkholderia oklahomensis C6786]KUY61543.1 ethanolamine ammonia-lyase [Burkholderia oklahomensis C6786]
MIEMRFAPFAAANAVHEAAARLATGDLATTRRRDDAT